MERVWKRQNKEDEGGKAMCRKGNERELISGSRVGGSHDGDEVVFLLVLREMRVRVREGRVVVLLLGLRVALEGNAVAESVRRKRCAKN